MLIEEVKQFILQMNEADREWNRNYWIDRDEFSLQNPTLVATQNLPNWVPGNKIHVFGRVSLVKFAFQRLNIMLMGLLQPASK